MAMHLRRPALAVGVALLLAACGDAEQAPAEPSQPTATVTASPSVTGTPQSSGPVAPVAQGAIVENLLAPWSIAPVSGTEALVSLRDSGDVLLLSRSGGTWTARTAGSVPGVAAQGEGGLLGLAVAPGGNAVFAMLTTGGDNRVVRMAWDGSRLGAASVVLSGIPKGQIHNGGRITFGPDGLLYIATGDAGSPSSAQDPASLAGKILRVAPDGSIPSGNPSSGSPVYSLGHRNVQGLAFDDGGRLWASEFGAQDTDEINLIRPGANYGWPIVEGTGSPAGLVDPAATWSPTAIASPSGIAFAAGSLWVATLRGRTMYEVPLSGNSAEAPIAHFGQQYGRLRDVAAVGPDALWLLTNNTDGRGDPAPGDDRIIEIGLERR